MLKLTPILERYGEIHKVSKPTFVTILSANASGASRGCIFSRVRPFYERAVSDLDRSMHRSVWG
jgi:hypothetical protein